MNEQKAKNLPKKPQTDQEAHSQKQDSGTNAGGISGGSPGGNTPNNIAGSHKSLDNPSHGSGGNHSSGFGGNIMDKIKHPRAIMTIALVILLPAIIGGVYVVQQIRSDASEACPATDIQTERVSNNAARISFDTSCPVKAQVYCSIGKEGVEFFCGEDETETVNHIIDTQDVTLSTDVPYYIYIDTGMENRAVGYIKASPVDATFGLDANLFEEEEIYGLSADDEEYDPALDVNQDGAINMHDKAAFYDEFE